MILIYPFLVILTAMSTKDLKDTETHPLEKDGHGAQMDIDLSTGAIHDKKSEKIESQDRGGGEAVGTGRDIQQEGLQQTQASYEHIKELEEKIDSLKTEIIRINSSNQVVMLRLWFLTLTGQFEKMLRTTILLIYSPHLWAHPHQFRIMFFHLAPYLLAQHNNIHHFFAYTGCC